MITWRVTHKWFLSIDVFIYVVINRWLFSNPVYVCGYIDTHYVCRIQLCSKIICFLLLNHVKIYLYPGYWDWWWYLDNLYPYICICVWISMYLQIPLHLKEEQNTSPFWEYIVYWPLCFMSLRVSRGHALNTSMVLVWIYLYICIYLCTYIYISIWWGNKVLFVQNHSF